MTKQRRRLDYPKLRLKSIRDEAYTKHQLWESLANDDYVKHTLRTPVSQLLRESELHVDVPFDPKASDYTKSWYFRNLREQADRNWKDYRHDRIEKDDSEADAFYLIHGDANKPTEEYKKRDDYWYPQKSARFLAEKEEIGELRVKHGLDQALRTLANFVTKQRRRLDYPKLH